MRRDTLAAPLDRVLFDRHAIAERVAELGRSISVDHAPHVPVLVTILRGGVVFLADLCRAIDIDVELDFMAVTPYGSPLADGAVRILKDLDTVIEGRRVIVVEDIIDTGLTLNYLLRVLRQRSPESIEVCVLLDKDVRRIVDLPLTYRGFSVPDRFLVGYGLDFRGEYRNLPFVATLRDEVWS